MIVLDTHTWIWWANGDSRLPLRHRHWLDDNRDTGLGISAITCWEIAKLVEYGRLELDIDVESWIGAALRLPGVRFLALTPEIAVESTRLPAPFHRDPADQIIVATARIHDSPLLTFDSRIRAYPHVAIFEPT